MHSQIPLLNHIDRLNQQVTLSQSPNNHHTNKIIKPKYCLNKTKKLKEFQKSNLFNTSNSGRNLQQYSQRFTYNQRTNSFEKENIDCSLKHYDVDYSFLEGFKSQKIDKVPKIQILKKKTPYLIDQNNESLVNKESQIKLPLKLNKSVERVSSQRKEPKQGIQVKDIKDMQTRKSVKVMQTGRLRIRNNKYPKNFQQKNSNQSLMSYIRSNPVNLAPIRLKQLRDELRRKQGGAFMKKKEIKHKQQQVVQRKKSSNEAKISSGNNINEDIRVIESQVKKLYDMIEQLRKLGYTDEKINQWIWSYCQNNKKFLQSLLFKRQDQHSTLSPSKLLHNLEDYQTCKAKSREFKRVINNHQIPLQVQDIEQLTEFLQQILVSRQFLELKRIQTQIQETSNAIKNNYLQMKNDKVNQILQMIETFQQRKKLNPLDHFQMLNFFENAKKIQQNLGKVKGLTIAGKKKYENITNVEIQLLRHKH